MADEPNPQQPTSPLPLNPDLAGYPTVEALRDGYRASGEEAKRLRAELDKRDQLIAQFLTNGGSPNGRSPVPDRRSPSPEDRLNDLGVPVDDVRHVIRSEVQAALQPITNGIRARGKVVSDHPDYIQFEADVAHYIETDPDLSQRYPRMYEADPVAAMEYAFLKFGESRRRSVGEPAGIARNGASDAAIPMGRTGDGRRAPDHESAIREAYERFQKTGSSRDAQAYAKVRLGPILEAQFRQSGQTLGPE